MERFKRNDTTLGTMLRRARAARGALVYIVRAANAVLFKRAVTTLAPMSCCLVSRCLHSVISCCLHAMVKARGRPLRVVVWCLELMFKRALIDEATAAAGTLKWGAKPMILR